VVALAEAWMTGERERHRTLQQLAGEIAAAEEAEAVRPLLARLRRQLPAAARESGASATRR